MMDDQDKLLKEAGNPLTKLFRLVLRELGIEAKPWNRRLTAFLSSPLSRVPKNAKDIGQERNNFNRAIAKKHITFKTFQKAVQILGPVKYSMSITMVMRDGRSIEVSTEMFKNPYSAIDDLSATITGRGLSPEYDNIDDNDDDEDDSVTDEAVEDMIGQIDSQELAEPYVVTPSLKPGDPAKKNRLNQLIQRNVPHSNGRDE